MSLLPAPSSAQDELEKRRRPQNASQRRRRESHVEALSKFHIYAKIASIAII